MPDVLASAWAWLILGIVLIAIEVMVPGILMIWFGIAAILTALIDWVFGLSWQANAIVFAVLSVVSAVIGWRLNRREGQDIGELPMLNRRADGLIGQTFQLDQAIVDREGRIRVGDSVWRVNGPDLPSGTKVRVTGVSGTVLVVELVETAG